MVNLGGLWLFSHRILFVRSRLRYFCVATAPVCAWKSNVQHPLSVTVRVNCPCHHRHFDTFTCQHLCQPRRTMDSVNDQCPSGDGTGSQTDHHEQVTSSKLLFVKLTEHASAPTKGSKFAAGYDLKSAYDVVLPKRGSALVKTDIQIQLPHGTYGRVAPRSGLALKNKIDVGAGVIDEDYRGNVGVILFNHGDEDFSIAKGDRIAQLICEKIEYPDVMEVENLDVTERGAGGFGSTGVKRAKLDEDTTVEPGEVVMDSEGDCRTVSPTKEAPQVLSPSKKQPMATN